MKPQSLPFPANDAPETPVCVLRRLPLTKGTWAVFRRFRGQSGTVEQLATIGTYRYCWARRQKITREMQGKT